MAQVFSCEFCEISKNTFFTEHLRTSASDNSMFEFNVNHQKVLNGYLLFDVVCQSDKEFYCYVCGRHLWALVMDLNRKTAFKMSVNEINTDNESGEVIDLD